MSPRSMRRRARNIIELTAKQREGYLRAKVSSFDIGARKGGIGPKLPSDGTLPSTPVLCRQHPTKKITRPTADPGTP
jgi:hypothetical protein